MFSISNKKLIHHLIHKKVPMVTIIQDCSTISVGDTINYARLNRPAKFGKVCQIKPADNKGHVKVTLMPIA